MIQILIITYYWPPAGGPGVQRVLKFVKYFPEFGITPIVLTVQDGDYPALDESLLKEIPEGITVKRVRGWEPYNLFRFLTGKSKQEKIPVGILSSDRTTLTGKISRWVRLNLFVPDGRRFLIRPFIKAGIGLAKGNKIDCILSSGPPHSLHLAALKISEYLKIPWIADFRDPWTKIYYYQDQPRSKVALIIDQRLEKRVLMTANAVVTVSSAIADQLTSLVKRPECRTIPNGFDANDFSGRSLKVQRDKFRITYVGNLMTNQNIQGLWKIISELINEDQKFRSQLQLVFVGNIHPCVMDSLKNASLMSLTDTHNYVPHTKAIDYMHETSILLFIIPDVPDNKGIVTGKLFDYLASGRPLLAIGPPDGDAAKILAETKAGPMIDPHDKEGLKSRIKKLYKLWINDQLQLEQPDPSKVARYERKMLTKQLADMVHQLVK
ncbi:MAG: glycosyltransferase family 4 protein [Chlorobi bacterium]|nr:glycosyltransferase family 4 protein [Chlorobiota bacterium]